MNLPTLSIIIPNYNHGHCLPLAVNAILKQSAPPLEIILIDDGSTDDSVAIIQNLARQHPIIKFHRNAKNEGVCFTVNRGIDLARGDYVFLAGADDEVLPGFLEKSLRVLAQHPQAGLSCTIGDWREEATGLNWHVGVGMVDRASYLSPQAMVKLGRRGRLHLTSHTVILKRLALIEAGKCIPELKLHLDWFYVHIIGFRYGVCVVPEPLAILNIQPNTYYQRCRRDKPGYRAVLMFLLNLLRQPQYHAAAELIRESGSLFIFGMPMLRLLLTRSEYRWFMTPTFLRKNLWHSAQLFVKRFTPAPLGNLYFRLAGYRTRTPAEA